MLVGMTRELPRRGNSRRANSLRPSIKRTGAPGGPWPAGEHPHQRGADDRHGCCRHCPRLISGIVVLPVRCTGRIFIKNETEAAVLPRPHFNQFVFRKENQWIMLATSAAKSSSAFSMPSPVWKRVNALTAILPPSCLATSAMCFSTETLFSFTKACCSRQFSS